MGSARRVRPIATEAVLPREVIIEATSSGEWLPAEQLRSIATRTAAGDRDAAVDLKGVDYLEATCFQILLAIAAEQKKRGAGLRLMNASIALRQWFEYAGATQHFSFE